jgi:hypothetical protein
MVNYKEGLKELREIEEDWKKNWLKGRDSLGS